MPIATTPSPARLRCEIEDRLCGFPVPNWRTGVENPAYFDRTPPRLRAAGASKMGAKMLLLPQNDADRQKSLPQYVTPLASRGLSNKTPGDARVIGGLFQKIG